MGPAAGAMLVGVPTGVALDRAMAAGPATATEAGGVGHGVASLSAGVMAAVTGGRPVHLVPRGAAARVIGPEGAAVRAPAPSGVRTVGLVPAPGIGMAAAGPDGVIGPAAPRGLVPCAVPVRAGLAALDRGGDLRRTTNAGPGARNSPSDRSKEREESGGAGSPGAEPTTPMLRNGAGGVTSTLGRRLSTTCRDGNVTLRRLGGGHRGLGKCSWTCRFSTTATCAG